MIAFSFPQSRDEKEQTNLHHIAIHLFKVLDNVCQEPVPVLEDRIGISNQGHTLPSNLVQIWSGACTNGSVGVFGEQEEKRNEGKESSLLGPGLGTLLNPVLENEEERGKNGIAHLVMRMLKLLNVLNCMDE